MASPPDPQPDDAMAGSELEGMRGRLAATKQRRATLCSELEAIRRAMADKLAAVRAVDSEIAALEDTISVAEGKAGGGGGSSGGRSVTADIMECARCGWRQTRAKFSQEQWAVGLSALPHVAAQCSRCLAEHGPLQGVVEVVTPVMAELPNADVPPPPPSP